MFSMRSNHQILADAGHYAITHVTHDEATHSIQIIDTRDNAIIADLHLDPMDNTLAGKISADSMTRLGADAEMILNVLSSTLQKKIGAKELILLPTDSTLPDYIPAESHSFKRTRHASRHRLEESTGAILAEHTALTALLDENFDIVIGSENARKLIFKFEERVFDLLNNHANFTEEKMTEYKSEDIQGVKARLTNSNVSAAFLLDKQRRLCGMIRSLAMGDNISYLSDETIVQDIISLNQFSGDTEQEKSHNRSIFLLAYVVNRVLAQIKQHDHFAIIAASGRENTYETVGFQSFPMQIPGYTLVIKLAPPCTLLNEIKSQLVTPPSNVSAIRQFGGIQSTLTEKPATSSGEQLQQNTKMGI